jgi:RNA polymerase sigma-70 factor (sigma-E family)
MDSGQAARVPAGGHAAAAPALAPDAPAGPDSASTDSIPDQADPIADQIAHNGRLAGFEAFVAARLPRLLGYAYALSGDQRVAEDLVQEALVRTGVAWSRVRRKERPDAYVKTTILRIYLNERRASRQVPVGSGELERPAAEPGYARVEDHDALRQALAAVPPKMRAVLVLRYLEGLPDEDIAQALKCSRGTVRTQAARGLVKLRAAYQGGVA